MKVHIHPHYAAYESYIRAIPSEEYEREEVYCNRRNTVERVRFGDKDFVIKKYKRPALINCLIYTWFRKSKAQRAFEYAELFSATGNRDRPSGSLYRNQKEWFLPHRILYFRIPPYPLVTDMFGTEMEEEEKKRLRHDLVDFTLQLHLNKVLPLDYNPKNIFSKKAHSHSRLPSTPSNFPEEHHNNCLLSPLSAFPN